MCVFCSNCSAPPILDEHVLVASHVTKSWLNRSVVCEYTRRHLHLQGKGSAKGKRLPSGTANLCGRGAHHDDVRAARISVCRNGFIHVSVPVDG